MQITCCFDASNAAVPEWIALLSAALPGAEVTQWQGGATNADYAVVWVPSQAFFDAHPGLRAVFNAGAGVDALLRLKLPAGVPIIRLEDAGMGEQMVDYVVHALLHFYREFDSYGRQQQSREWRQRRLLEKKDFPVGILGYGVLGGQVGAAVQARGFPVHAWSRTAKTNTAIKVYHGDDGLDAFLTRTRVLVCLLPLTDDTRGIIDRATLGKLQAGAYLINIARGGHVVEDDLLERLDDGQMAGAMLDVFAEEPLHRAHAFWTHPRVTLTPHVAAVTVVREAALQIAGKIATLERGGEVSGVITNLGY